MLPNLWFNLAKSEFLHANLTFLCHIVGQGQVKHVEDRVDAISLFPVPTGKTTDAHSWYGLILQDIL